MQGALSCFDYLSDGTLPIASVETRKYKQSPSCRLQVSSLDLVSRPPTSDGMPAASLIFDRHALARKGEINVVFTNGKLWHRMQPGSMKRGKDFRLVITQSRSRLLGLRSLTQVFHRSLHATHGIVSAGRATLPLFFRQSAPSCVVTSAAAISRPAPNLVIRPGEEFPALFARLRDLWASVVFPHGVYLRGNYTPNCILAMAPVLTSPLGGE